jgi:hypothetical protein
MAIAKVAALSKDAVKASPAQTVNTCFDEQKDSGERQHLQENPPLEQV